MAMDPKETERIVEATRRQLADPAAQIAWKVDHNIGIMSERSREMGAILASHGMLPLGRRRVLEVGCGTGGVLASLRELGAADDQLYGIDLVPERVRTALERYPFLHLCCGDGEHLEFERDSFDVVLCFTVFSSILSAGARAEVAREALRVLRPDGALLWYDMRVGNPRNRNVRGVRRREIEKLFKGCLFDLRPITLVPPLARRVDATVPSLYAVLSRLRFLRTHYLGLITKDSGKAGGC